MAEPEVMLPFPEGSQNVRAILSPVIEQALLDSLVAGGDCLSAITYTDPERMFAALFKPLTQRVSTQVME